MYNYIKKLFYHLTGGRPMIDKGYNFTDCVSGERVRNYVDFYGRKWMATNKWSLFRVERNCKI